MAVTASWKPLLLGRWWNFTKKSHMTKVNTDIYTFQWNTITWNKGDWRTARLSRNEWYYTFLLCKKKKKKRNYYKIRWSVLTRDLLSTSRNLVLAGLCWQRNRAVFAGELSICGFCFKKNNNLNISHSQGMQMLPCFINLKSCHSDHPFLHVFLCSSDSE